MRKSSPLIPLRDAIEALLAWLKKTQVEGVVIGGVAASLLGRPRTTKDVDAVVWVPEEDWRSFLEAAKAEGIRPRIRNAISFARKSRVLLLRHFGSGIDLDVSLGAIQFERDAIDRRRSHNLAGLKVPLPTPEDLAIMKAVAHRPRDLTDIEGLLEAHPKLNRKYMIERVREFADVLETPEIARDFESLLSRSVVETDLQD